MDNTLNYRLVYDLTHRLWYQIQTKLGLPKEPNGPIGGDAALAYLEGSIKDLKDILPLLEKHVEEIRNGQPPAPT